MAEYKTPQPFSVKKHILVGNKLVYSNLRDRRVALFWFLELTSLTSFIIWLLISVAVSKASSNASSWSRLPRNESDGCEIRTSELAAKGTAQVNYKSDSLSAFSPSSIDIWFSLSITAATDAMAVVFTFNGPLIRRFHYAVSQRMMFLAFMISWAATSWHLAGFMILGCILYKLFGVSLDKFERPLPATSQICSRKTLSSYSQQLGCSETTWNRALLNSLAVTVFGLSLSFFLRPPWAPIVPIVHILFESAFLSTVKSARTPRYLLLCSPPFFANICVHWGVTPLITCLRLSITAWSFVPLLLLSRIILDLHLHTAWRQRRELHWARAEALVSTRQLVAACAVTLALEYLGLKILTYIKPIIVLVFFGVGNAGFLAVAAYNVAIDNSDNCH